MRTHSHGKTLGTDTEQRGDADERGTAEEVKLGRYDDDDVKTAPWPPRQP
jgi:hypothetical protein